MFRHHCEKFLLAVLALAICMGTLQAATPVIAFVSSPATSISCDTVIGLSDPVVVTVTLPSGATTQQSVTATISSAAQAGLTLTSPATQTVRTGQNAVFSFTMNPGCKGATDGTSATLTFSPASAPTNNLTSTLLMHVSGTASALALSQSSVTLVCTRTGSTDAPATAAKGGIQTVSITSPANGGTPFYVDQPSLSNVPWLAALTGTAAAATNSNPTTAGVAAKTLILTPTANCNNLAPGFYPGSILLDSLPPAAAKTLTVNLQVGAANNLVSSGTTTLTYAKGSGVYSPTTITIYGAVEYLSVDPTTVPNWLTISNPSGTTTVASSGSYAPVFTVSAPASNLAPGIYTANIHFKASFLLDFVQPITLTVTQGTTSLTVAQSSESVIWTVGTTLPTFLVTPVAAGSTISYTIEPDPLQGDGFTPVLPTVLTGLAIPGFASPFYVGLPQAAMSAVGPSPTPLVGHIKLHWDSNSADDVVIKLSVTVVAGASQSPTISGVSLSPLPTATAGTVITETLYGSGFSDGSQYPATVVGVLTGANVTTDKNIIANVSSGGAIVLTITVPSTPDPLLPFSGSGGPLIFALCNPLSGTTCSAAQASYQVQVGGNPVVQAVTSASSFYQVQPPALTPVAPYDVLSLFGTNFCISGNTGCTSAGSSAPLYGQLDPVLLKYATTLPTPGDPTATQRYLTVTFYPHGGTTPIAQAPLLFATNTQINLIVPGAVSARVGSTVDIVVTFGYGTAASAYTSNPSTLLTSVPFPVTVVSANPGIFVTSGDGQGEAAATDGTNVVSASNAAASLDAGGDTIVLYLTGLGQPDSPVTPAPATTWNYSCLNYASYPSYVSRNLTSDDGLILQSAPLNGTGSTVPCFISAATSAHPIGVKIGGVPVQQINYAGWVPDSVAGLYQINVVLPSLTQYSTAYSSDNTVVQPTPLGTALPVQVTVGSATSAPGATLFVAARATMGTPTISSSGVGGGTFDPSTGNLVVTRDATAAITVTFTATYGADTTSAFTFDDGGATLPSNASWNGATGVLTIPADTVVTGGSPVSFAVTATDTATSNVTGTMTINLTVQ